VDFGEAYSIKSTAGKFSTVQKADVEKIEDLAQPVPAGTGTGDGNK